MAMITADPQDVPKVASFAFTAESMAKVNELIANYPPGRQASAVIGVLDLAQRQHGWLPRAAMDEVARLLDMAPMRVYEVATFYTMFHLKPIGRHHFQVCRTLPCQLMGAEGITSHLEKKLGVKLGETSADGRYTLSEVECLGSCGTAPMLQLNDDYHENLTAEKLDALIASLK